MIGELLISILIYLLIGMLVIHISVSFADVKNATLVKAFAAALIGLIASLLLGWIPFFGIVLVGIAIMVAVRIVYMTTWPKALVAAIVYIVVSWIINFIINAIF
jgi:hypothetical protein